ncbi:MAG: gliding motility-associated ABC transporter substrate-binding protein GldG [Bacteroidetes bacterium]|nr:gliding motility-associated ABC transporter substrate-binding protein GldG [Bacteroidota bacterium]MBK7040004.1 gliding motility-associated ABC transporter substrate-binding protein GldG [Bacteroidota bacterium]
MKKENGKILMALNQHNKKKNISRLVMLAAMLLLFNIISSRLHVHVDATEEKRFSLSAPTKKLLKGLKENVIIEVYLKGTFPAGFKKLSESTKDLLQQFKEYGNGRVKFSFINPLEGKDDQQKKEVFTNLASKGINPVNVKVQGDEDEGYSEKIIFPAAKIAYNQKEISISLLESHLSMTPQQKLNNSEAMLEYKFASAIKYLIEPDRKKIAYIVGHGEALGFNTFDMLSTLEKYYDVDTVDLTQNVDIGRFYTAAIICKPTQTFDEKNKFKIDQFVMQGGKLLMCIDMLSFSMDSLRYVDASMAMDYGLNLDDMLFKYGVRINPDFIEDYQQANPIPVTVGMMGNQPDIQLLSWSYFPFSISESKHPIVNNLDAVMFMYANSIDTVANPEINKTILLTSSNRSRRVPSPVRISLSNLKFKPQADMFKEKNIPMAVLLEGKFKSVFANRMDDNFLRVYKDSLKKPYNMVCEKENQMIVVGDGDVFLNDYNTSRGPLECGFYKFTEKSFANKSFILNCMEYLTDDYGLLEARNKNLTLRLLDTVKVKKQQLQWQLLNIGLPAFLLFVFGSAYFFFRRKKYEGKVN